MKRLFVLTTIIAASLIANSAYSQVYVNAHVGFGFPVPRIHISLPAPPVVYQEAPAYQEGYAPAPAPVAYEQYPDAAYYTYPAWNGHYRDRCYYEHYRPYYERERGRRDYDHERYEHRDYEHRDYDHREHDRGEGHRRDW
ncbi:MAG TPA: hypothetical protein VNS58_17795 [Puia sp.]|nr:hypothetical protein [Puia sp.]